MIFTPLSKRYRRLRPRLLAILLLTYLSHSSHVYATAALAQENAELQAAFDLMVRQLSARDAEISQLRLRIAELESDAGVTVTPTLGCNVDAARALIVAESFIYDREQVLLSWLNANVASCKLLDLQQLDSLAARSSLNQSRALVLRELAGRGEPIPDDALLGVPMVSP